MEKASAPDAARLTLEQTLLPLFKGVGWATLEWGVFALFFVPLFVWIMRSAKSRQTALNWIIVVGLLFLAAVGVADFWKSFGEAFAGGANRYRAPTWFSLTIIAIFGTMIATFRVKRAQS